MEARSAEWTFAMTTRKPKGGAEFAHSSGWHQLESSYVLNRSLKRTIHRTIVGEEAMDSFDRSPLRFIGRHREFSMNPLDDEHAFIVFNFTARMSRRLTVVGINLARCQRAGECA